MAVNTSSNSSINTSYGLENVCPFTMDSEVTKGFKTTAYVIALLASLVGNSLVIAVVLKNRRMRTVTNYLIVNMAVSDLLLTLFNMPQSIYYIVNDPDYTWPGGNWGIFSCKFLAFTQSVSVASSVLSLTAIAVDRFLAVVFPLKRYVTFFVAAISIATVWFVSVATSAPLLYAMTVDGNSDGLYCLEMWSPAFDANDAPRTYTVVLFIGFYMIPLVTMSFLYGILIWRLWIRKVPGNPTLENQQRADKSKKKVLKMLMTVVVLFAICWLPVYITQFLFFFSPDVCLPAHVQFTSYFLGHVNSAINPCIYVIFNENFRRGFLDILKLLICRRGVKIHPTSVDIGADNTYIDGASVPRRPRGTGYPGPALAAVHPAYRQSHT